MHWAALVLPPVLAVVVVAGVAFYQHMQLREQEQAYWAPFRQGVPPSAPAEPRLVEQLLVSVEAKLRHLRAMLPGPDRSRRIRALRAEYHPDRYVEVGSQMAPIVVEVSAIVNTRTEPLLREDQVAAAAAMQR